jgi:hypothetical protein
MDEKKFRRREKEQIKDTLTCTILFKNLSN